MLAGRSAQFTATATGPGMDDTTFEWDWGNGTPATTLTRYNGGTFPFTATDSAVHAYAVAGTYTVTLRVSDDDGGLSTTSILVII